MVGPLPGSIVDAMTNPESPHADPVTALRRFLDVPFRAQTYRNLAYLALAFPLGLAYFVGVTTGLSMGVGLLVTLVGVPILLLTLVGTTMLAGFEANLARWLLGMEVQAPRAFEDVTDGSMPADLEGLLAGLKRFLTAPTTWTSLVLVLLKFVLGIVAFVALTVLGTLVVTMLGAPLIYDVAGITYHIGPYLVDTPAEVAVVAVGGLVSFFVGLHLLNGLARLFGEMTATLLGDTSESSPDALQTHDS